MLEFILACFKQLALKPKYKGRRRTNDQWTEVLLTEFHIVLLQLLKENPRW